ncbi:MAG: hypothetical protein AAGG50_01090 [Bacteroidota bacterium]
MTRYLYCASLGCALLLAACTEHPTDPASLLPPAFAAHLDTADLATQPLAGDGVGYGLARAQTDSGAVLLQWVDLRHVRLRHVLGVADTTAEVQPGFYHPTASSPAFALLNGEGIVATRIDQHPPARALMNAAFFETPGEPTSALAFPLAVDGTVVSGGSSPYGPGRPGADTTRWGQLLRVLAFADSTVQVTPYDHVTGEPLGSEPFADAIVSYAPESHPSRVATRYHVLGPLDADPGKRGPILLIATSDGSTTIAPLAALMTRLGVRSETQMTVDGGASVFLWTPGTGVVERPSGDQPLPHYLAVEAR